MKQRTSALAAVLVSGKYAWVPVAHSAVNGLLTFVEKINRQSMTACGSG